MRINNWKELVQYGLVLASSILILAVILVFSVYSLGSFDFIIIRILSIGPMFAFIGLILLGLSFLSVIGTMLNSLRQHMLIGRLNIVGIVIQEMLMIAGLGLIMHMADQFITGVEIGNVQTEILTAIFLYVIVTLLSKMGDQVKKQDDDSKNSRAL